MAIVERDDDWRVIATAGLLYFAPANRVDRFAGFVVAIYLDAGHYGFFRCSFAPSATPHDNIADGENVHGAYSFSSNATRSVRRPVNTVLAVICFLASISASVSFIAMPATDSEAEKRVSLYASQIILGGLFL